MKLEKDDLQITITKAELVEKVFEKIGFSKKEAKELVELVFDSLKNMILEKGKVKISKFGHFVIKKKEERLGRNPQTGEAMPINARCVLSFKPSSILRSKINSKNET